MLQKSVEEGSEVLSRKSFYISFYILCSRGERAEKRMRLTRVRGINSSSDNFKEIKWKLKGSVLEPKSQKHLNIQNMRKAQRLSAVGDQLCS